MYKVISVNALKMGSKIRYRKEWYWLFEAMSDEKKVLRGYIVRRCVGLGGERRNAIMDIPRGSVVGILEKEFKNFINKK